MRFLLLLCVLPILGLAQNDFEWARLTDNDGYESEILIINKDWKSPPLYFRIKSDPNDAERILAAGDFNTLELKNHYYKSIEVTADLSSNSVSRLGSEAKPNMEDTLFIAELLLQGPLNLYFTEAGDHSVYFVEENDSIFQLVNHQYINENGDLIHNEEFRFQLFQLFQFQLKDEIERVRYAKSDLIKLFQKYFELSGSESILHNKRDHKAFELRLRPGIGVHSLTVDYNTQNHRSIEFPDQTGVRWGIELSYILPFRSNSLSFTLEPAYKTFSATSDFVGEPCYIEYNNLQLGLGMRYRLRISEDLSMIVSGGVNINRAMNSTLVLEYNNANLEIYNNPSLNLGLGLEYKRLQLVFAYETFDLLQPYIHLKGPYRYVSGIIGFRIF